MAGVARRENLTVAGGYSGRESRPEFAVDPCRCLGILAAYQAACPIFDGVECRYPSIRNRHVFLEYRNAVFLARGVAAGADDDAGAGLPAIPFPEGRTQERPEHAD